MIGVGLGLIGEGVVAAGLIVGALSTMAGAFYAGYRTMTKLMRHEATSVVDEVVEERLSTVEHDVEETDVGWKRQLKELRRQIATDMSDQLAPIYGQVFPNGGTSLRDRVDLIAAMVEENSANAAKERRDLRDNDRRVDGEIAEIRHSLGRLETGETPPDHT